MKTYSASHFLVFARTVDECPGGICPVEKLLRTRSDVVSWIERDNDDDKSESRTKALYRLNLETPDIGNKFIEVYKEAQKICERCREQSHEKN